MRIVYDYNNKGRTRLQQGGIFSGAIADGIEGCKDLLGLVITPRCDIANKKVSTIHYLPMIPFHTWKYEFLSKMYQTIETEKLTKRLNEFCKVNNISETLFDSKYHYLDKEIEKVINTIKGYKDIMSTYRDLCRLKDLDYCKLKVKDWSKGRDKIKDLIENKQAHYYLIEDWRDENAFLVIMLRDVKRLDFQFAIKMEKGISEKILSDEDFHKNDIVRSETESMVYKLHQVVQSPFLEHIMEAFSKNFCRIGIDRIEESVLDSLKSI